MATRGSILFIDEYNQQQDPFRIYLYTYHDGFVGDAFLDLVQMPQWVVKRSVLEEEIKEKGIEYEGRIGPWQLGAMKYHLIEKEQFESSWRSNYGINITYCDAPSISSMLISKYFDRWQISPPKTSIDLTVVCTPTSGYYDIIVSDEHLEYLSEYLSEISPDISMSGQSKRVPYAEELKKEFYKQLYNEDMK